MRYVQTETEVTQRHRKTLIVLLWGNTIVSAIKKVTQRHSKTRVCVCVCVCERERERESERERE